MPLCLSPCPVAANIRLAACCLLADGKKMTRRQDKHILILMIGHGQESGHKKQMETSHFLC